MIGRVFGKLQVKRLAGEGPRGYSWWCLCECGNEVKLTTFQLNRESNKCCGCTKKRKKYLITTPKELREAHKLTHISWKAMLARCFYLPEDKKQKCYKGIKICERWLIFANFLEDMGDRPSIEHSLDREDPDGDYDKENCRWLTKKENSGRVRWNTTPERNKKVSEGLKEAYRTGKISLSAHTRKRISEGAKKRIGRKMQSCEKCGENSFLPLCQRCRGTRPPKKVEEL